MTRVHNFNAGPSAIPLPALELAQKELIDFEGSGMSIMEHSHRGKVFDAVHNEAIALLRELLGVPEGYDVLFMQGGASQQFAQIPMNLRGPDESADYIVTGVWGKKAIKEAKHTGKARAAATTELPDGRFVRIPTQAELDLDPSAAYVHMTSNNTIFGTQFHEFPNVGSVPLVCDMSSDIMSRKIDVSKFAFIYAGAQKNLGPSGLTIVVMKKELVEKGRKDIPFIFQYRTIAAENSLYNTPPTFGIYMLRNVLRWVKDIGGIEPLEAQNRKKADVLYATLDERADFYRAPVEKSGRSFMNVVWNLPTPELEAECIAAATKAGFVGLKGHRLSGGLRASIYNAVSLESVNALCEFLRGFKK
jgi:phosphoserine aminotransferase